MSLTLASYSTGSRKRKLRDVEESAERNSIDLLFLPNNKPTKTKREDSNTSNLIPPGTTISKIDTGRSLDHRLISSCSSTGTSTSCEESFASNYSEQTFVEALSLVTHTNTRREKEKMHTSKNKKEQGDSISSSSHKFNKVEGLYNTEYNGLHMEFWDESSWGLSKSSSCVKKNRKKSRKKDNSNKVEGLLTTASNSSHSNTWENTSWKLRTLSQVRAVEDATDDDDGMEIEIKDCKDPREDSVQWKLRKRLNDPDTQERKFLIQVPITRLNTSRLIMENQPFEDQLTSIGSPYVLYRWLRTRLAAGLVRSCFDCLHQMLKKYYDEVKVVLKKLEISATQKEELASLVIVRDRLAGIWCVYAHFTLEVGCLALAEKVKKSSSQKKQKNMCCLSLRDTTVPCDPDSNSEMYFNFAENAGGAFNLELENRQSVENNHREPIEDNSSDRDNVTYDDISSHAISVLLTARDCPLVGNHTAIALSLGRMIVSSTIMEQSKVGCIQVHLPQEIMSARIRSAIDVCWDNIDTYRNKSHHQSRRRFTKKPVSETTLRFLSNFEMTDQKLCTEKRLRENMVLKGIESTLDLPKTIRSSLLMTSLPSEGVVIGDRNTIRSLCGELNRWSRLEEELETNHQRTIRFMPSHELKLSFLAEELPLFAPVKSLSDPLKLYGDTNKAPRTIIWEW
mmetsp:Transcript_40362/g.43790  ORF Transcript_40362/g.43790 Transcript_40362/m.43790 type:complete len:680 (+) Transcript_40362:204-2243(+)